MYPFERLSYASIGGALLAPNFPRAPRLGAMAAVVALGVSLAGCASTSPPAASPAETARATAQSQAAPSAGIGHAGNACTLVSAAELRALGVRGPGRAQTITVGSATVNACTWGHPPATELHLQVERLDQAAATQVRVSLGRHAAAVAGVGDGARGQFGSVLAAVDFSKGNTFASLALFGPGVGGRKAAFLSVAKNVASRL